jgi:lipid-A-disaccharide synthase
VKNYLNRLTATRPGGLVSLPIEICVGRTQEIIELAQSCIAVSGSVGLEMLYRARPCVVVYRIGRIDLKVCKLFLTTRYISLVNLLAEKELYPEFLTDRCEAEAISEHILRWLNEPETYQRQCRELKELYARVGQAGACERAATFVLSEIDKRMPLKLSLSLKDSA